MKKSQNITIYDIAKEANLSIATVSRVMNNSGRVKENTRLKVMKLLNNTTYRPKVIKNKIPCIGVLLEGWGVGKNLFNNYNTTIMSGISDYVFQYGLNLSIFPFSGRSIKHPHDMMRHLQERDINGIAVIYREDYNESLAHLNENHFPHFSIGGGDDVTPHAMPFAEEKAMSIAMEYLRELGHRRIGFISTDHNHNSNSQNRRLVIFKEISKSWGIRDVEELIMQTTFNYCYKQLGYETIMAFKDRILNKSFDALVCMDDNMAVGALKALDKIGISVPKDISLIGFNDTDFSEYTNPALTVVSHPLYEIGYYAAKNINSWFNCGESLINTNKKFIPELIVRNSCIERYK